MNSIFLTFLFFTFSRAFLEFDRFVSTFVDLEVNSRSFWEHFDVIVGAFGGHVGSVLG